MDIVVIGAGAGGLVVAIGATKAGKKVLLVEKDHFGGDCTNFGCIPSKALISSAHSAHQLKWAKEMGFSFDINNIEGAGAFERVRSIVASIRHHEEPPALEELGLKSVKGLARFIDPHTIEVGSEKIRAKKFVIATGSYPFIPPIEGLEKTPYLTNETVFDLKEIPKSLICLGGGPIGSELAQAFARLGTKVTIVQRPEVLLKREDPKAQDIIKSTFEKEGIDLKLGYEAKSVAYDNGTFVLDGQLRAEQLLVSIGRRPQIEKLNLDAAGVAYDKNGITIDSKLRTSQKHIFAIGDCTGEPYFTHRAEFHGRHLLKNLILPFSLKLPNDPIPRATFTDPEVASIGLNSTTAPEKGVHIYELPFSEVDRAICMGRTEGWIQIVTKKWSSQILGATIVGERAGEMLTPLIVAMKNRIPLRKLANIIHPYPTYGRAVRKLADRWLTEVVLKR